MIRPQNKKNKQVSEMRNALKRGDHVTTIGGLRGRVLRVREDDVVTIEVGADKVKIDIMRWGISKIDESAPAKPSKAVRDEEPELEEETPKRKPRKLEAVPKKEAEKEAKPDDEDVEDAEDFEAEEILDEIEDIEEAAEEE